MGHVALIWMEANHCKSTPCLVWCPCVFCRWIYNVFNLPYNPTWRPHWRVMRIYGWELLTVCHLLNRSCDHKHCDSGDMFLICYVTSRKHILNGLGEFLVWSPSRWVTTSSYLVPFGLRQVEIKYLISRDLTKPWD